MLFSAGWVGARGLLRLRRQGSLEYGGYEGGWLDGVGLEAGTPTRSTLGRVGGYMDLHI